MDCQKNIKLLTTPGNRRERKLKWIHDSKIVLDFKTSCLKQNKTTFTQKMQQICFSSMN